MKAAKTKDGLHCSQSTDSVQDGEEEEVAVSPVISPGDPVFMTSICDNKCFVPHLGVITADCPSVGFVGLLGCCCSCL